QRLEERGELLGQLRRMAGRQGRKTGAGRAHRTVLRSSSSPPTIAVLASMALRMIIFLNGSSTSQKRSSSAEASTVNAIRQPTPMAGCQLASTSAQPTNSSVCPVQNVCSGKGALKIFRRCTWSSTCGLGQLRVPTARKKKTIIQRPSVTSQDGSL